MAYPLILTVNKVKSAFSQIVCAYIFTGDSIIFAHIDKETQKQIYADKTATMKAEGKGFLKRGVGLLKALSDFVDLHHNKTEDEILKENSMNFKLDNDSVEKIVYRPQFQSYDTDNNSTKSGGTLVIKARGEKIKARHTYDSNSIKKYLRDVYGKRAK
jgi:hypothetical protein